MLMGTIRGLWMGCGGGGEGQGSSQGVPGKASGLAVQQGGKRQRAWCGTSARQVTMAGDLGCWLCSVAVQCRVHAGGGSTVSTSLLSIANRGGLAVKLVRALWWVGGHGHALVLCVCNAGVAWCQQLNTPSQTRITAHTGNDCGQGANQGFGVDRGLMCSPGGPKGFSSRNRSHGLR